MSQSSSWEAAGTGLGGEGGCGRQTVAVKFVTALLNVGSVRDYGPMAAVSTSLNATFVPNASRLQGHGVKR